jgi:SAM-dependent methyltransferase
MGSDTVGADQDREGRGVRGYPPIPFSWVAFLASWLLFQIELISAKAVLPAFGGSYLVWGSAMVLFQALLLAGYACAHRLAPRISRRRGAWGYLLLMAVPLATAGRMAGLGTVEPVSSQLWLSVVCVLAPAVGPAFLMLSTVGVVIQRWSLARGRNPYPLYAASNLGSLLGLLSYPLLVEPLLSLPVQMGIWWCGYGLLLVLMTACLPLAGGDRTDSAAIARVDRGSLVDWFLASFVMCSFLMAVTNLITFDVASVPLLWALPLFLYLAAFVLAFKTRPWCPPWISPAVSWALILGAVLYTWSLLRFSMPPLVALGLHLAILFLVCVRGAAALVERRPADDRALTVFYLMIGAGGVCGTLVVSWLFPLVSLSLAEYPFALVLAAVMLASAEHRAWGGHRISCVWQTACVGGAMVLGVGGLSLLLRFGGGEDSLRERLLLCAIAIPIALFLRLSTRLSLGLPAALLGLWVGSSLVLSGGGSARDVFRLRNYYGIYRLFDRDGVRFLQHGTTLHGREFLVGPQAGVPLAYYHPSTPIGNLMSQMPAEVTRIGMVGLGTGALAAYLREGQSLHVFELDPDGVPVAENHFTFLRRAVQNGGRLSFTFGDGRRSLHRLPDASFDWLIVDAFSSGSIPVHLLTVEAFREYVRVTKPGGLVLLHVSNRSADLAPVAARNAEEAAMFACEKTNEGDVAPGADLTHWVAISGQKSGVDALCQGRGWLRCHGGGDVNPWTDQSSDLVSAIWRAARRGGGD